jgi:hypothetical protein
MRYVLIIHHQSMVFGMLSTREVKASRLTSTKESILLRTMERNAHVRGNRLSLSCYRAE